VLVSKIRRDDKAGIRLAGRRFAVLRPAGAAVCAEINPGTPRTAGEDGAAADCQTADIDRVKAVSRADF